MKSIRWLFLASLVSTSLSLASEPLHSVPECSQEEREVEPLFRTNPYFPHSALMFCVTGSVTLTFTIDTGGGVEQPEIIESEPAGVFDRSALEAVRSWRFIPACRSGSPAERRATQTIEFKLPEDSRQACERRIEAVDAETSRLLGDLGARYAVLAETKLGHQPIDRLAELLEQPMTGYSSELAAVADFHQRALEDIHASYYGPRPTTRYREVMTRLMPGQLASDSGLAKLQAAMDGYRESLRQALEHRRALHASIRSGYRTLERETDIPEARLSLLVHSYLGNVEASTEAVEADVLEPLEPLQRLVDLFVLERGRWYVEDGEIVFDRAEDQAIWADSMQALMTLEHAESVRRDAWLNSFRDYAD